MFFSIFSCRIFCVTLSNVQTSGIVCSDGPPSYTNIGLYLYDEDMGLILAQMNPLP